MKSKASEAHQAGEMWSKWFVSSKRCFPADLRFKLNLASLEVERIDQSLVRGFVDLLHLGDGQHRSNVRCLSTLLSIRKSAILKGSIPSLLKFLPYRGSSQVFVLSSCSKRGDRASMWQLFLLG